MIRNILGITSIEALEMLISKRRREANKALKKAKRAIRGEESLKYEGFKHARTRRYE
jgi:hypothetical protein